MKKLFQRVLAGITTFLIRLRYKVEYRGMEVFDDPELKGKPLLICPNHVTEVEPIILVSKLTPRFQMRPIVVEDFYNMPGAGPLMKLVGAVPTINLDLHVNEYKRKKAGDTVDKIIEDLKDNQCFCIYPSGMLRHRNREVIGGRSLVYRCVQEVENVEVVLTRISGFSGSIFSRMITGESPDFWKAIRQSLWVMIKNGIFFIPKRKVLIEFERMPKSIPKETKLEFNRALEDWYNQYPDGRGGIADAEPLNMVSYAWWSKTQYPDVVDQVDTADFQDLIVPKDVEMNILYKLSEICGRGVSDILIDERLVSDLGLDSLDVANLYTYLSEQFDMDPGVQPGSLVRVGDLYKAALGVKEVEKEEETKVDLHKLPWGNERGRPCAEYATGATLIEVFINSCKRMKKYPGAADDVSGVVTYSRMLLGVIIMAEKIRKMKGENIGIMLPSSVGAAIMTFATMLAGKVPVMVNFTVGRRSLEYTVDFAEIDVVLTSQRFLDRASHIEIGSVEDKLCLVEDLRKRVHVTDKLRALRTSMRSTKGILKHFKVDKKTEDDTAVIIFTSGTESNPKGVPLSSKNIICNHIDALGNMTLTTYDVMLGALPFFHVFGMAVTGIMGLCAGIKVYYCPDPTDAKAMVRIISSWRVTITCLAPSFYANLFRASTFRQLRSVRYMITGAEKMAAELLNYMKRLGACVVEGYGCTETSPIISLVRPGTSLIGVGQALASLDVRILNIETENVVPQGEEGELIVHGNSVFNGYLKRNSDDVFIEIDGKRFYRTGDKAYIDERGYINLVGRLKRFVKIGGEMVSLYALEQELIKQGIKRKWFDTEDHSPLCIMPYEEDGKRPKLILLSTYDLECSLINTVLQDAGFPRISRISECRKIETMPLLGSGKVSYKKLDELLKEMSHER
ncbi:MAG: Bifunctional protein Aas [Chlamydiia bacterium]|nr:Bifunctional protein Aas [Chlamydiia bacterium]